MQVWPSSLKFALLNQFDFVVALSFQGVHPDAFLLTDVCLGNLVALRLRVGGDLNAVADFESLRGLNVLLEILFC